MYFYGLVSDHVFILPFKSSHARYTKIVIGNCCMAIYSILKNYVISIDRSCGQLRVTLSRKWGLSGVSMLARDMVSLCGSVISYVRCKIYYSVLLKTLLFGNSRRWKQIVNAFKVRESQITAFSVGVPASLSLLIQLPLLVFLSMVLFWGVIHLMDQW